MDSTVNFRKAQDATEHERDQMQIIQLKTAVAELSFRVKAMSEGAHRDGKKIKELTYEKSMTPKMDQILQFKMMEKEY